MFSLEYFICIFITSGYIEGGFSFPPMLGLQLAFGMPVWFLVLSPFQEFFFRGWLQPRFQDSVGKWIGLFLTSACFSLWHFFPPFEGTPTSILPVTSFSGIITTVAFGMIWGYTVQRTNNIVAPWISHALAGIAVVLPGKMTFIYYAP
jgi:membrane protease YdiL (CAAX protease family)